MNNKNLIERYPEAINVLKRSLRILTSLKVELAAAAISMKLVDVLDCLVKKDFKQSLDDLWACSLVVQRILYDAFSEKIGKESERAIVAKCAADDGEFEKAARQYILANTEITKLTGFSSLFLDKK